MFQKRATQRFTQSLFLLLCAALLTALSAFAAGTRDNPITLTEGAGVEAQITNGGDYVYYTFTPSQTKQYVFRSESSEDTYGYLYNSEFIELASNDDGDGRNFRISYQLEAGTKYYFGARFYSESTTGSMPVILDVEPTTLFEGYVTDADTGNGIENVNVTYGSVSVNTNGDGYYRFVSETDGTLAFSKFGYQSWQSGQITAEPGIIVNQNVTLSRVNAETIAAGDIREVTIQSGGEYYFFRFVPEMTKTYHFSSAGDYDTYGYALNETMQILDQDDESGDGSNFDVAYELVEGETYYFAARFYSESSTGIFPVMLTYDRKGIISGYVTDAISGGPLENVSVTYGEMETSTDADGYYELNAFAETTERLIFHKKGYVDSVYESVTCVEDETIEKDTVLVRYIPENPAMVTQNRMTGTGTFDASQEAYFSFTPGSTKTYDVHFVSGNYFEASVYDEQMVPIEEDISSSDNLISMSRAMNAGATYYFKVHSDNQTPVYVMLTEQNKGVVFGQVTNAGTGSALAGATVRCAGKEMQTGTDGLYMFALAAGTADVQFSKSGFIEIEEPDVTVSQGQAARVNGVLSETLEDDDMYRVVLTWGASPSDLDSHLQGPNYHVYYSDMNAENANLDVDDTSSYGPETTTFKVDPEKTYSFYVHDYSNGGSPSSTALAASGATVNIYRGSSHIGTRHVPSGTGIYWNVFTIRDGKISYIDKIGKKEPGAVSSSALMSADQYLIHVVDEDGNALEDADVAYDDQSKSTDEYGNAYFDAYSEGNPIITVEKNGYLSWTNQNSSWEKSASRYETVILYPESVGNLKLRSARYSNFANMSFSVHSAVPSGRRCISQRSLCGTKRSLKIIQHGTVIDAFQSGHYAWQSAHSET